MELQAADLRYVAEYVLNLTLLDVQHNEHRACDLAAAALDYAHVEIRAWERRGCVRAQPSTEEINTILDEIGRGDQQHFGEKRLTQKSDRHRELIYGFAKLTHHPPKKFVPRNRYGEVVREPTEMHSVHTRKVTNPYYKYSGRSNL